MYRRSSRQSVEGFTLIELLVVMVLLGLLVGIATTSLGSGNQARELKNEVDLLYSLLSTASEEAIMSNRELGLEIDSDGYVFLVFDEDAGTWSEFVEKPFKARALPEWVLVDYKREGEKRELKSSNDEESGFGQTENSRTPNLEILSSGEVSAFVLGLELEQDSDTRYELSTDEYGQVIRSDERQEEDS